MNFKLLEAGMFLKGNSTGAIDVVNSFAELYRVGTFVQIPERDDVGTKIGMPVMGHHMIQIVKAVPGIASDANVDPRGSGGRGGDERAGYLFGVFTDSLIHGSCRAAIVDSWFGGRPGWTALLILSDLWWNSLVCFLSQQNAGTTRYWKPTPLLTRGFLLANRVILAILTTS
ncbi:Lon protease homolog, mitochondrial [Echinococcus multilocularis]|uniref:Lon protease homolog, mitochondrial n=1 Tax=Echinococcus multilocularis TaxID=6211 RepID=A0A0S4MI52_ECHMU|nr:Lon protease homolog, mitochondrial [Echinococcus multilocularis]